MERKFRLHINIRNPEGLWKDIGHLYHERLNKELPQVEIVENDVGLSTDKHLFELYENEMLIVSFPYLVTATDIIRSFRQHIR